MRILWFKTELLHPIDKGGKIRTYEMLRELKKQHHITYLTLDDGTASADALTKATEYAHEVITVAHHLTPKFSPLFYLELLLNLASALPYAMQKYVAGAMQTKVIELVAAQSFDILVCDFLVSAVNLPKQLAIPTLLFQHNVEAMIWRRHYEIQRNPLKKCFLKEQWRKSVIHERITCQQFDFIAAVSEVDADIMRAEYALTKVAAIPTGVNTDYFRPQGNIVKKPYNLVFTGSMDWLPNQDAMTWFIADIWPVIKQQIPQVTLTVVGRNPFASLVEASKTDPAIEITGRVIDVRPFMEAASVYIVPMRIGSGTRLKIYEAMAMELPMVSTTVGAEGLPVADGTELLLRDTPETFATAVVQLLQDTVLAGEIGTQAAQTVREKFGWHSVAKDFTRLCQHAIEIKTSAIAAALAQGI